MLIAVGSSGDQASGDVGASNFFRMKVQNLLTRHARHNHYHQMWWLMDGEGFVYFRKSIPFCRLSESGAKEMLSELPLEIRRNLRVVFIVDAYTPSGFRERLAA